MAHKSKARERNKDREIKQSKFFNNGAPHSYEGKQLLSTVKLFRGCLSFCSSTRGLMYIKLMGFLQFAEFHILNWSATKGLKPLSAAPAMKLRMDVSYAWMFMYIKFIVKTEAIYLTQVSFSLALNTEHFHRAPSQADLSDTSLQDCLTRTVHEDIYLQFSKGLTTKDRGQP